MFDDLQKMYCTMILYIGHDVVTFVALGRTSLSQLA